MAHMSVKGLAGQSGAEPELMALLFDHDRRSWRRLDDEKALAVLLDGGIQVACWPVGQARFDGRQQEDEKSDAPPEEHRPVLF